MEEQQLIFGGRALCSHERPFFWRPNGTFTTTISGWYRIAWIAIKMVILWTDDWVYDIEMCARSVDVIYPAVLNIGSATQKAIIVASYPHFLVYMFISFYIAIYTLSIPKISTSLLTYHHSKTLSPAGTPACWRRASMMSRKLIGSDWICWVSRVHQASNPPWVQRVQKKRPMIRRLVLSGEEQRIQQVTCLGKPASFLMVEKIARPIHVC